MGDRQLKYGEQQSEKCSAAIIYEREAKSTLWQAVIMAKDFGYRQRL